jgi:predicted DNA-binding transcriptional regulator YafY
MFLGKLSSRDIQKFANLAGVNGLFPSLKEDFLTEIFDDAISPTILVKGHNYELLEGREADFELMANAISTSRVIKFEYVMDQNRTARDRVYPYRLINQKGVWYLAGLEKGSLKTFSFQKIKNIHVLEEFFDRDPDIEEQISREEGIWFGDEKIKIVLLISKQIANYFLRRKLIVNQVINKKLEDGSIVLSTTVGHINQVLPIVKYWIPHIKILEPNSMADALRADFKAYSTILDDTKNLDYLFVDTKESVT